MMKVIGIVAVLYALYTAIVVVGNYRQRKALERLVRELEDEDEENGEGGL